MRKILNIGEIPNNGKGDKLRHAFDLSQQNFVEIYKFFGDGQNITSLSVRQKLDTPTNAEVDTKIVNATTLSGTHMRNVSNPHNVTKEQIGLSNVDNTSDANKPISTETQKALDLKANKSDVNEALDLKADKTEVSQQLSLKEDKANKGVSLKEDKANKGAANGYASLDENKKVPVAELYEASTTQKGITQLVNNLLAGGIDKAITAQQVKNFYEVFTGGQLHFKIPNPNRPSANWIVQFFITSSVSSGSTPTTSNFPVAFPNTCVLAVCSYTNSLSPNSAIVANITSISKTQIGLTHQQAGASAQFNCIAIGY